MGYGAEEVTGHGFRATARTMLHERLGFSPDVIEAKLAHSVRDSLGRAYNRTEFIDQRQGMLKILGGLSRRLRTNVERGQRKWKRHGARLSGPKSLRSSPGAPR